MPPRQNGGASVDPLMALMSGEATSEVIAIDGDRSTLGRTFPTGRPEIGRVDPSHKHGKKVRGGGERTG